MKDNPRDEAPESQDAPAPREEFNEAPARDTGRDYAADRSARPAYGRDVDAGRGGGYNNDRPAYNRGGYNDRPAYNNDRGGYGDKPGYKPPYRPGFKPGFRPGGPGGFGGGPGGFKKKFAPSSETNAENYYYKKQMEKKTPIIAVMMDGETINGWIEWYDRDVLKINRDDKPNLLVFKSHMKYLYKDEAKIAILEKQRAAEALANPQPDGAQEGADEGQDQDHGQDHDQD
jgi:hypothetical protein